MVRIPSREAERFWVLLCKGPKRDIGFGLTRWVHSPERCKDQRWLMRLWLRQDAQGPLEFLYHQSEFSVGRKAGYEIPQRSHFLSQVGQPLGRVAQSDSWGGTLARRPAHCWLPIDAFACQAFHCCIRKWTNLAHQGHPARSDRCRLKQDGR
jgi:hypothetical protein